MRATVLRGDVFDMLPTLAPGSVDCCVTSPPYWQLRDYGTGTWEGGDPACDHKAPPKYKKTDSSSLGRIEGYRDNLPADNAAYGCGERFHRHTCPRCGARRVDKQLGMEATVAEYVTKMVEVFRLVREALAPWGTVWLNVGDTYAGGGGGNYGNGKSVRSQGGQQITNVLNRGGFGIAAGNLCLIPWRLAIALQDDEWIVRSVVVWHKPAPMPASLAGWRWARCRVKMKAQGASRNHARSAHGANPSPPHQDNGIQRDAAQWADCPGCSRCEPHGGYVLRRGSWRPTSSWEPVLLLAKGPGYYCDGISASNAVRTNHHEHKTMQSVRAGSPCESVRPMQATQGRSQRVVSEVLFPLHEGEAGATRHTAAGGGGAPAIQPESGGGGKANCLPPNREHESGSQGVEGVGGGQGIRTAIPQNGDAEGGVKKVRRKRKRESGQQKELADPQGAGAPAEGLPQTPLPHDAHGEYAHAGGMAGGQGGPAGAVRVLWQEGGPDQGPCHPAIQGGAPHEGECGRGLPPVQFEQGQQDEEPLSSANLRDVWVIPSEPLQAKHFASFPSELVYRALAAGTSQKGYCPACGMPWARVVETTPVGSYHAHEGDGTEYGRSQSTGKPRHLDGRPSEAALPPYKPPRTLGWKPTCNCTGADCLTPRAGLVLDPFCGSGRTGLQARRLGLDFVGCELSPEYCDLAEKLLRDDCPLFAE